MTCEKWSERIIDSLANELSDIEGAALKGHLEACPTCAREARLLRGLLDAFAEATQWQEGPGPRACLLAELRAQRKRIGARRAWRTLGRALSRPVPAYAAILLVLLGLAVGRWAGPRVDGWTGQERTTVGERPADSRATSRRPLSGRGFEAMSADAVRTWQPLSRDSL